MKHRMVVSVLALVGFFVATYLLLWKVGVLGVLACSTGGCETVQTSQYSDFLGIPVALYGVVGFVSIFVVSIAGLQPRWLDCREPTVLLAVLSGVGVAFSAYLTYLEASVIHAWCEWCVASAVIITLVFGVSLTGWLTWRAVEPEG
jgi:uncharacterized membrane protein